MDLTSRLLPSLLLLAAITPALHADVKRGMDAIARKDYNTAWRELMPLAMQGDSEAEALVGTMLFQKINHPEPASTPTAKSGSSPPPARKTLTP